MDLKMKTLLFVLLLFWGNAFASDFYPEKTAERLVKSALKIKNISLVERFEIAETNDKKEPLVVYSIQNESSAIKQFAVFTQARGRYDLFDYLLIVSSDFRIEKVEVIKYRSEHGGEIASKKWLSQFEKYSGGDLKYASDISAISGATLSAKSITTDIPKVIQILKMRMNKNS